MRPIVGLDVSTCTGCVVMDDKGAVIEAEEWEFPKLRGMERVWKFYDRATKLIADHLPGTVVIEGYGYAGPSPHTLVTLVEIGTAIRMVLDQAADCKVVEVAPTALKKFVTGSGNAKKDSMMLEIYKRWGFDTKSNNISDAYGLARIGVALSVPEADWVTKFQVEVLSKLKCS